MAHQESFAQLCALLACCAQSFYSEIFLLDVWLALVTGAVVAGSSDSVKSRSFCYFIDAREASDQFVMLAIDVRASCLCLFCSIQQHFKHAKRFQFEQFLL